VKTIEGLTIPTSLEEVLDPATAALIVYDMQVGIMRQLKDPNAVLGPVRTVLEAARRARVRTIFTRHMSLPRSLMGVSQYRMAMAWQRKAEPAEVTPWFLRDTPGFAIVPELAPLETEAVFDKISMSAFEGTPLEMALRDCGVRTIVLVGVAMEIGIEPTARHAADLGFIPVIVADACGAGHQEAAARSLESLRFAGDSIVADAAAVCAAFDAAEPRG
jgi:nicotinamidase-related amidase